MASRIMDALRVLTERIPFAKAEGPLEWLAPDPSDAAVTSDAPFPGVSAPVVTTVPAAPEKNVAATRTITKTATVAEPSVAHAGVAAADSTSVAGADAPQVKKPGPARTTKAPAARTATSQGSPAEVAVQQTLSVPAAQDSPAEQSADAPAVVVKKAPARKSAPRKTATKKAAPAAQQAIATDGSAEPPVAAAKPAAKRTTAKKAPAAKKSAAEENAPGSDSADPGAKAAPVLPIRDGEDPWTPEEIEQLRRDLTQERERLTQEIADADAQLTEMLRDAGDGAVDDPADAGSRTLEREQEISLAANSAEMLDQVDRALRRLADGEYGVCENCGNPIGKLRLQAFPRATLCLACKGQQERR